MPPKHDSDTSLPSDVHTPPPKRVRESESYELYNFTNSKLLKKVYAKYTYLTQEFSVTTNLEHIGLLIVNGAYDNDLLTYQNGESVAASALYLSYRIDDNPRPLGEFSPLVDATEDELRNTVLTLQQHLSIPAPVPSPEDFVQRFNKKLNAKVSANVPSYTADIAIKRIEQSDMDYAGKSPTTIAAAALYAATIRVNVMVTQEEVSDVTNVSKSSIRKYYDNFLDD